MMIGPQPLSLHHLLNQPLRRPPRGQKPPMLLLLHGIGASEYDLFALAEYLDPRFLVISLQAPFQLRPDSFAWFEVQFTGQGPVIRPEQAEASRQELISFIQEAPQAYQANPSRVYLMGFSQGAIMSLGLTLTRPELLAGVVAMSGRTLPELFEDHGPLSGHLAPTEKLRGFPLLVVHGLWDRVLAIDYGRATRDRFADLPVDLDYREFDMGHTISDESLETIKTWLAAKLDSSPG
ncbi:MAG TPA: phospholipase [Anaerolineae bacterium]|nr:phospholipase [Anaerolineae bacterium]